jgi:hypothetical protein
VENLHASNAELLSRLGAKTSFRPRLELDPQNLGVHRMTKQLRREQQARNPIVAAKRELLARPHKAVAIAGAIEKANLDARRERAAQELARRRHRP